MKPAEEADIVDSEYQCRAGGREANNMNNTTGVREERQTLAL